MAKVRRIIQKVERAEGAGFDDQLWPINLALLVLTGFVAGIIVVEGGFDDPRLLHNGWFRLATLAVSVGGLFWVALRVNRRLARRMQLAILLSLMLHIGVALVLKDRYLELIAQQETQQQEVLEPEEQVTRPEYVLQPLDQLAEEQAFEKPVETQTPTPKQQTEPLEREQTTPREAPMQKQPVTMPKPEPTQQPSPVKLERQQMSAPRRAEQTSKLSRPVELAQNQPQTPVAAPSPQPKAVEQQAKRLEASATEVARAQSEPQASQQPATHAPTTVERRRQAQVAARAPRAERTPDAASSTPTLQKQVAQPAAVPRADAQRPVVARATQPSESEQLAPRAEVVERTRAAGPQTAKQATEPTLDRPTELAQAETARRQPSEARPTLAKTEQPAPNKRPVEMERTPEQVTTPENRVAQPASPQAAPGPKSTSIARSRAQTPREVGMQLSAADAPRSQAVSQAAQIMTARAEAAEAPSLRPTSQPTRRPQKTLAAANLAASPVSVDRPAVAQSASQDRPAAKPSSAALSKARSGFVGRGRSQNADVAMKASQQHTAPTPSAAARRATATTSQAGPELSPSAPAKIAKARAGAEVPAATAEAQNVQAASVAGAAQPAKVAQAASASVERRHAAAPLSEISASVGNVEVDTGPTQIVPETGSGRASGGGQPTIAVNMQEQNIERTRPGGAALAAVVADDVEPMPVAPAEQGGGAPSEPAGLQVAEVTQKRAGGVPTTEAQATLEVTLGSAGREGDVVASSIRRAAGAEALPGEVAGGGADRPERGKGRQIAMLAPSEVPTLDAMPHDGGAPQGAPVDAAGNLARAAASGLPGRVTSELVGAAKGPATIDAPAVGAPGSGVARAEAAQGADGTPTVGGAIRSAPLRKTATAELPSGLIAEAEMIAMAGAPAGEAVDADTPSGADLPTDLPARVSGSLPVRVAAVAGPGGLGLRFSPEAGLPNRRAQREAQIVHNVPEKFLQKMIGGAAVVSGEAKQVAEPFARRGMRNVQLGRAGQPSAKTEAAIELGLDFLARHQSADGSWTFNDFGQGRPGYEQERAAIQADTAATGLALLSFLGAGYDHFDDKYQDRVAAGLNFLVKNQRPDGDLYLPQDQYTNRVAQLYSHGIASIALCEAYGMTGDPRLAKAAQSAIDFIVASQHEQRGGWRYTPGYMSDLSVSGWQLMALRSGELAGLEAPQETYESVKKFLDRCQASSDDGSRYVYNPYAANTPTQRHGRSPSTVMTSVGLLMRLYTGWNREHDDLRRGADHLLANLPTLGSLDEPPQVGTIGNPMRDTYYWYYATQVMFHMKGAYWEQWNDALHPLLTESQIQSGTFAGSWDPRRPVPDKWGPHAGRIYITTLNLLSLEVYYRHLPIYEATAK